MNLKKLIIILFVLISTITFSRKTIKLNTFLSFPTLISQNVLTVAYDRIGYDVEFIVRPSLRSLIESNSGKADGEVFRVQGIEKDYPNLIMVSPNINYFELRAYSKNYNFYIESKESLKNYKIGIALGIIIYEKYGEGLQLVKTRTINQNWKMLFSDRVDFVLSTDLDSIEYLNNPEYKDIHMLEPALNTVKVFHYLNIKHKDLVPKISKVLEDMEKNGEIKKIRDEFIKNIK